MHFFYVAIDVKLILWIHHPVVSHSWFPIHVSIARFTRCLDWVPKKVVQRRKRSPK